MRQRILFVGPIADKGGPAIKNRILVEQLKKRASIDISNTYDQTVKARLRSIFSILFTVDKYIIVAVSRKGRNLLYPILLLKQKLCCCQFACVVIGGNAENSFTNRWSKRALHYADMVTAETKGLVANLQIKHGLNNIHWMPNYKEFGEGSQWQVDVQRYDGIGLRLCFMSSMRDMKGVRTLYEATCRVIQEGHAVTLDYYGPIRDDFDKRLLDDIERTEGIRYCGEVKNEDVLRIMSQYDVFMFPTEYPNEGFPAVLVEAQAVGLPVVASDINYNSEIIVDRHNGIIFPHKDIDKLAEAIRYCATHRAWLKQVSVRNVREARQYEAQQVIDVFCKKLKAKGWPV